MAKVLIMVTQNYPSGKSEVYLEREISFFSKRFNEIHVYPIKIIAGDQRPVPPNVFVHDTISSRSGKVSPGVFLRNFFFCLNVMRLEFIHCNVKPFFIRNLRNILSELLQCIDLAGKMLNEPHVKDPGNSFYSVWMDEGALLFAILKAKKKIPYFVFRLHGYDLYDERRTGNYMPFRYFNFMHAKKIFIVSKAGKEYLENKKLFPQKLVVNYSGLYDMGLNPFSNEEFTLISVSNLIPLKRVDKIIEILRLIPFKVKWIHFGEGEIKPDLINVASSLPGNIEWKFNGQTSQEELIRFYSTQSVNLLIHLSETEGLPMAVVEALSFGIPAMACDVGGLPEIINESTGILLPEKFDVREVADKIIEFRNSHMNSPAFRKGVKEFWKQNFDAEKNYSYFFNEMA